MEEYILLTARSVGAIVTPKNFLAINSLNAPIKGKYKMNYIINKGN